jgi:hypothetical protein
MCLLMPLLPALGWGALTHIRINRAAYRRARSEGAQLPDKGEAYFGNAGTSPDFISIRADLLDRHEFDYAHNLFDPVSGEMLDVNHDGGRSASGRPSFGEALIKATNGRRHSPGRLFALGWTGHQLADRYAHGEQGYVNATAPFPGLVQLVGPAIADRLGPHGLNEVAIDALELQRHDDHMQVSVPVRPLLLYRTSRRFRRPDGLSRTVLWPWQSLLMARFWQAVLRGGEVEGIGTVEDLLKWVNHPLWPEMARYYEVEHPYRVPMSRAVDDIVQVILTSEPGGLE